MVRSIGRQLAIFLLGMLDDLRAPCRGSKRIMYGASKEV